MEHENCLGESNEWYTPPEIFDALGCRFDLDPFSPSHDHWTPADAFYTQAEDGMAQDWGGRFVFVNPPFGGRNGHVPALLKFLENGNGVGVFRAYTSAAWFHDHAVNAECFLFPRGKTKFVKPDGSIGKAPGGGVVFLGVGERAADVLSSSGLGWFVRNC